jgi:hypothetical protein
MATPEEEKAAEATKKLVLDLIGKSSKKDPGTSVLHPTEPVKQQKGK